jgi:hypothetical protein
MGTLPFSQHPSLFIISKMAFNVAMAFENADDFKHIGKISKENHIAFESKASDVGAQFRPRPPQCSWQGRELAALLAKLRCELQSDSHVSAFAGDVVQNGKQVFFC